MIDTGGSAKAPAFLVSAALGLVRLARTGKDHHAWVFRLRSGALRCENDAEPPLCVNVVFASMQLSATEQCDADGLGGHASPLQGANDRPPIDLGPIATEFHKAGNRCSELPPHRNLRVFGPRYFLVLLKGS